MKQILILFLCSTFAISCAKKIKVDLPPIVHDNFKSLTAPNTSYEPGYIFRVPTKGKNKGQVFVTSLNAGSIMRVNDIEFKKQTQSWKYGTFFKFLANSVGEGKYDKTKIINIEFSIDDCKLEQLKETDIEKLLKNTDLNLKSGNRYYVISEAIKTKGINFKLKDDISREVGFNTDLKKFEAEGKFTKNGKDSSYLSKSFAQPYRIMYKIVEFNERGTMVGEGRSYYFTPVTEAIFITN